MSLNDSLQPAGRAARPIRCRVSKVREAVQVLAEELAGRLAVLSSWVELSRAGRAAQRAEADHRLCVVHRSSSLARSGIRIARL